MQAVHNQVMATINLFKMHQERGQTPQNFRDQFTAMRQVCEQLGLQIGPTKQRAQAILKKKGVTNPTSKQLSEVKKQAAEEYHAILFLYLTDRQRYGKAIEDMENNVLNKLDPFPKTVSKVCQYLIKWCNNYGVRSVQSEAKTEWRLTPSVMTRKSLRKVERKRKLHVSDARRWAIMRVNARKNCHKSPQRKDQTCLYLMKTVCGFREIKRLRL